MTFVLNSLFIGATVELARDKQYVTAAAAGTAASFFYIGGIINAGRSGAPPQPDRAAACGR